MGDAMVTRCERGSRRVQSKARSFQQRIQLEQACHFRPLSISPQTGNPALPSAYICSSSYSSFSSIPNSLLTVSMPLF